jgi:hypothetical protein
MQNSIFSFASAPSGGVAYCGGCVMQFNTSQFYNCSAKAGPEVYCDNGCVFSGFNLSGSNNTGPVAGCKVLSQQLTKNR